MQRRQSSHRLKHPINLKTMANLSIDYYNIELLDQELTTEEISNISGGYWIKVRTPDGSRWEDVPYHPRGDKYLNPSVRPRFTSVR